MVTNLVTTDRQISRLPTGRHAIGGRLYLRVSPKGKRTWVVRDRSQYGDKWKRIGEYPRMTLADARRASQGAAMEVSVDAGIKAYMSVIEVARPEQVRALLRQIDIGSIGISRVRIMELLRDKAETAPIHANRIMARYKEFFDYCVVQGWIKNSPLSGVKAKFVGGKERPKNRVLSDDELTAITDPVLWFILLTGARPSEALWVLTHKSTSDIPTKRTYKDGYTHTLPRSHLIRWALRQPIAVPGDHRVMSRKLRRGEATYTPHDLRRTFATRLSDLGVAPHVVEKMLGHKMMGMLAVYNHAEYWPERHAAQRVWDRWLLTLWRKKIPDLGQGLKE